jgi:type I restriction enzyme R subunit
LEVIRTTDMALIVSTGQNEIEQMKKLGLDIAPHRKRMNDEALDEKFKEAKDPLRLVFRLRHVADRLRCAELFDDLPRQADAEPHADADDCPGQSCFPGKHSGLIVDYANVFASLEKALAIYAKGRGGEQPIRDKQKLVESLRQAITETEAFCRAHMASIWRD